MYEYRQVIHRMRMGEKDRAIVRTGVMGRIKCKEVRAVAGENGWLDPGRPLSFPAEGPFNLMPGRTRFPGDLANGKVFLFCDPGKGRTMRKPSRPWRPFLQSGIRFRKAVKIDFERVHFCNHGDHPEGAGSEDGPGSERVHFCNHGSGVSPFPVSEVLKESVSPGFLRMSGPVVLPVTGVIRRPDLPGLFLIRPVSGIGFHLPLLPGRLAGLPAGFFPAEPLLLISFPRHEQGAAMATGNPWDRLHQRFPLSWKDDLAKKEKGKQPSLRCHIGKRIPDLPEETMKKCVRNFSERINRKGLTPPPEEGTRESISHPCPGKPSQNIAAVFGKKLPPPTPGEPE